MKARHALILALMLAVSTLIWNYISYEHKVEITYPRLGMPAIVLQGQAVQIDVQSNQLFPDTHFEISIKNASEHRTLAYQLDHAFGPTFSLLTTLPADIPLGQYDLILRQGDKRFVRHNAVQVLEQFKDDIKVIQFADLPWLSSDVLQDYSGDLMLEKIIEEVNLINPDLVLISGDNAYGGTWGQYHSLYDAMRRIKAPMIMVPGNHEYEGWNGYLSFFGKTRHSIKFGHYQIISFNSGHARDQLTFSQFDWLKQAMYRDRTQTFIVQLHHPVFGPKRESLHHLKHEMLELFDRFDVQAVLSGHLHADSVYDKNGVAQTQDGVMALPPYAVVTTAGRDWRQKWATSQTIHGYRLLEFEDRKLKRYSYDYDGDHIRDASSSIPWDHIRIKRPDLLTAEVENRLNESFKNARIDFPLDFDPRQKKWTVRGGQISRLEKDHIQVLFDLQNNSQHSIQLMEQK